MNQESLITISEASHILGVSEAALRQWTDEGKIKAFVTPGGHRRYSRADLKKFMGPQHRTVGIKELVLELEDSVEIHREIARKFIETTWYNRLSQESRGRLAELSRRLLDSIIRYLTEPSKRDDALKLAHDVGRGIGETLASQGLPLTDSVEAFLLHRDPVMNVTIRLMKRREALSDRIVEAIPLVGRIMDEALVSLVAAHQQSWRVSHIEPERGVSA